MRLDWQLGGGHAGGCCPLQAHPLQPATQQRRATSKSLVRSKLRQGHTLQEQAHLGQATPFASGG